MVDKLAKPTPRLPLTVALRVFLPFALGYFLSYVFRTVNSVIAPDLVADIGLSAADLGLLTGAFFLSFALFQLPLGILLDRYGPRRVEAALLLLAALGALLFAWGDSLGTLTLARALIGLGVSACLMASFKAFVLWFSPQRLPLVNALLLALGGSGALAATVPVEWSLELISWRTLFVVIACYGLAVAAAVYLVVPEHPAAPAHASMIQQVRGLREVFQDRYFWRITPLTTLSQGSVLAVQGLWAGPWLRDVAGLARDAVAFHLGVLAVAIVAGFLVSGLLADRLARRGVRPASIAIGGMGVFVLVQALLVVAPPSWALPLWAAFGFFGTAGTLSYAVLSQAFQGHLAGRVNTALNLMVFLAAFGLQWAVGAALTLWEDPLTRTYAAEGYRYVFAVLTLLQLVALAWFFRPAK